MTWLTPPQPLLARALGALTAPDHTAIVGLLQGWDAESHAELKQIYLNLNAETALTAGDLTGLLTEVAAALRHGLDQSKAWKESCWAHQFRGPELRGELPTILGRALPLNQYEEMVADASSLLSRAQARGLIRRVSRDNANASTRDVNVLRSVPIGQHVVWATFDAAMRGDPFAGAPTTARELRVALGLGHLTPGAALVKLRYFRAKAGDVLILHRPTIGDAGDYCYYRPTNAGDPHGWVVPLAPNAENYPKRPEAVHQSCAGRY